MKKRILLTYFTASWCEPCQYVMPIVKELAEEKKEEIDVSIIDVEKEAELVAKIGIDAVPTYLLVKDNQVLDLAQGYMSKEHLLEFIEKNKTKA